LRLKTSRNTPKGRYLSIEGLITDPADHKRDGSPQKEMDMNDEHDNEPKQGRKRGLTSVALQWIADKMRRTERIKEELQRGTYQVDSNKIAEAILNGDAQPKH
jgi:anti-sigma28 factor (negative regulator of flagellin synthesis)